MNFDKNIFKRIFKFLFSLIFLLLVLFQMYEWATGEWIREVFIYGRNYPNFFTNEELESFEIIFLLFILPFLPFLLWGLYSGFKKQGKKIFLYPFLGSLLGLLFAFLINLLLAFSTGSMAGLSFGYFLIVFIPFSISVIFLLFPSLVLLKFRKENLFFKFTCFLFLISIIAGIGISKYFSKINPSWCENKKLTQRGNYRDECYYHLALRSNDFSLCMQIQYKYTRESCLAKLAKRLNNPKICEMAGENEVIDSCYRNLAEESRNSSFCEEIKDNRIKDSCYNVLGQYLSDPSLCLKIKDKGSKEYCLHWVATYGREPAICEMIEENSEIDKCYYDVAIKVALTTRNASFCEKICEKIKNLQLKDLCYYDIARDLEDFSLCLKIEAEKLKEDCLEKMSKYRK
jgi:hypothetical protein